MLMISEWWPLTAALSMRMSLSGRRPIVYRSLFMLYSAITWPSRLKTNLAMLHLQFVSVSAEPAPDLVEDLGAGRKCVQDVCHDDRDVIAAPIVIRQLNQLLGHSIQISTKGVYR